MHKGHQDTDPRPCMPSRLQHSNHQTGSSLPATQGLGRPHDNPSYAWQECMQTAYGALPEPPRACTCTGQAAASPSAQMVCPSICLVTSHSMSISSSRASPFRIRVMMSYSQGAPSLQATSKIIQTAYSG